MAGIIRRLRVPGESVRIIIASAGGVLRSAIMPAPTERADITVRSGRAVLAAVRLPGSRYDRADPFGELRALAEQAGAVVVGEASQARERPVAGTCMGRGKLREIAALCDEVGATLVIFDHDLSPKQIAGVEKIVGRKVVDRSELILDIFASRAVTREARLQVELARLDYMYPRLRAMWDHLERIAGHGGIGGIGTRGPGERQLETDRRLVQRRRLALVRELGEIRARRRREVRARARGHVTVGLVGYTNAGKSTFFNTMTGGGAYADDRVFATLSTRTRAWDPGGGPGVMLSDTVGFVRDLPHDLIASFLATLEEATHADLLLVVLDVSDPAAELHHETVMGTLEELFRRVEEEESRAGRAWTRPRIEVLLNKADRLRDDDVLPVWRGRLPGAIPVCALPPRPGEAGLGHEAVRELVRGVARGPVRRRVITVPLADSRTIHALERGGEVVARDYRDGEVVLTVEIGDRLVERLRSAGARLVIEGEAGGGGWSRGGGGSTVTSSRPGSGRSVPAR